MKTFPTLFITSCITAMILSGCGNSQEASEKNFKVAIKEIEALKRVCLPIALSLDANEATNTLASRFVGEQQIMIPLKNQNGDKINKRALAQIDSLVDAGLYREGKKVSQSLDHEHTVQIATFNRTDKGNQYTQANAHNPLLCIGSQEVTDIKLFTIPAPANGLMTSRVVYHTRWMPTHWARKMFQYSDSKLTDLLEQPQTQTAVLALTNKGWVDIHQLY